MDSEKPLAKEGYALMGAAFEVHGELGGGMAEEIYQQALQIELRLQGIPFKAKQELVAYYKGVALEKKYIPDLYVFDRIVVELKAVSALAAEHEAQLMNYMRITRHPVGYLINFAPIKKVEWTRFVLSEYVDRIDVERNKDSKEKEEGNR